MRENGKAHAPVRRDRFASGAQVRLELSDGDWVSVRQELTYGQQRRLAAAGVRGMPAGLAPPGEEGSLTVDLATFDLERLATWLLDWSLVDADGEPVLVSREAIEALHPDTAGEINAALDAHIEAQAAKKGSPAGASAPAVTSPSAGPLAGAGTP